MRKTLNMTEGKPFRLLVAFALPLMFGNIFQQLYTVVDTAIVGRGVGMEALAALGSVDWLNWMLLGIVQGFAQGFSIRMSQKFGEQDSDGLKQVIGRSAMLCIWIALICTALSELCLPLFLQLLRVKESLRPNAMLYSRIIMGGIPVVMFFNYCSSVLRAVGDSKTPLIAMVVAALTNILLDCVAVFLLKLGIGGAAAATVFSQCLSGLICAWKLWSTPILRFERVHTRPDRMLSRNLLGIGSPIALRNIIISLGGMAVSSIVNGFSLGFIAGFTATGKLYGILEVAAISYGHAITTYVGQNYGAGRYDRIRSGMKSAIWLSVLTSVIIAILMILFGRPITMLFISSDDPSLVAEAGNVAYYYLCTMAVFLPVLYLLFVYTFGLQGIGKTVQSMFSGVLELVMRVALSAVIGYTGFEMGIFGAEIAAWVAATLYLAISYYRNERKLIPIR